MIARLQNTLKSLERRVRGSFGGDMSTRWGRFLTWLNFQLLDHAFLRVLWTNFDTVAQDVYRSNHPGAGRLARYKRRGISAILNLRGNKGQAPWLLEQAEAERLGLDLRVAKIYARKAASREEILHLIQTLREMPKPFVMHCKSGADRAGFAAVLYAHIIDGQSLDEAKRHLNWRYLHLKSTRTGIVDHVVELYEARNAVSPLPMEEWFRTEYDPKVASDSFRRSRGEIV